MPCRFDLPYLANPFYPQILWVNARAGLEGGFALLFGKLFPGRTDVGLQQPDKAMLVLGELSGRAERLR